MITKDKISINTRNLITVTQVICGPAGSDNNVLRDYRTKIEQCYNK